MLRRDALPAFAVLGAFLLAACGTGDAPTPEETAESTPTPTPEEMVSWPDTTFESVWAYLEGQDYQANWALWPGTSELYEGTRPHGALLTTYANDVAMDALGDGDASDLGEHAVIVKENHMPDSTLAAVTVMYKVAGYNPEHQDWWFTKYNVPADSVEAVGRVPTCGSCHQSAEGGDYVFTPLPGQEADQPGDQAQQQD